MDPYLERPEIWRDFHDSLITYIREALQPLLRPKYAALTQDRLYVIESERPIYPDLAVVETSASSEPRSSQGVLVVDEPVVIPLWREEVREPYIQIIEPAAENRVVTAIEVLSPDNKAAGSGRTSYVQKREEFWLGGTHLVEIDLLRSGLPTVRVEEQSLAGLAPWRYVVAVTRILLPRREIYSFPLERRLPRIRIPLAAQDPDVVLDLQAAFERTWDAGPYPELLYYENPPPGELTEEELAFCRRIVAPEPA
jgi:hypothetical protein